MNAASAGCEAGSAAALASFDLASGQRRWSYCSEAKAWRHVVGTNDELIYISSSSAQTATLTAVDAQRGTEKWHVELGAPKEWAAGPFAGGGTAVLDMGSRGAQALVGVDAVTGIQRWRLPGPAGYDLSLVANTADVAIVASLGPRLRDRAAEPGLAGPGLRGLDRATGALLWSNELVLEDRSGVSVSRAATAVSGDTVLVPAGAGLVAVDARTGAALWRSARLDHPAVAAGVVVGVDASASAQTPRLAALDATTGQPLWTAAGAPSYGEIWAIGAGTIVVTEVTGSGVPGLVAYELRSGTVRWRRDQAQGQPQAVVGDDLILLWEGSLAVLSATDGSTRWAAESPLGSTLMSSVGATSNTLFVSVNSLPWGD